MHESMNEFRLFLEANKKSPNCRLLLTKAALAARTHRHIYQMYRETDSSIDFLEWLWNNRELILAIITALLKLK